MKEEGATEVNAYTRYDTTQYFATIDKAKSYWLVQTFSQMLFDKVLTEEDLNIEKRALQTEIGEVQWYSSTLYYLKKLVDTLSDAYPDNERNIFFDDFSMQEDKEPIPRYIDQKNNKNFSLDEVLQHYKDYYYPKNITLKVAGNFNLEEMKKSIQTSLYAKKIENGDKSSKELLYNATLDGKPYKKIKVGSGTQNLAYVGAKYVLDDYKKYLTLVSYTDNLANRMQQLLRNELGKTYSVNSFDDNLRNAAVIGVNFGSLHDNFETNLAKINTQIQNDASKMQETDIQEALKASHLWYSSNEHDSSSLLSLIDTVEYLHTYHQIYDKTPYEIFQEITPESFQETVSTTFTHENKYSYIYKDYYLFPYDMMLLSFLMIGAILYAYIRAGRWYMKYKGLHYELRDIRFTRRLSNRFFSTLVFVFVFLVAELLAQWTDALLSYLIYGNLYGFESLEGTGPIVYYLLSFIWYFFLFLIISYIFFKHMFTRLDVTDEHLNFIGRRFLRFAKEEILEIKKVSWSLNKFSKTLGWFFFFLKPLVMLKTSDGKVFYIRSKNAQELEEDLLQWKAKEK